MNEWALFYFWASSMLLLYVMSIYSPSSKILDTRFKNMLRSGFTGVSAGVSNGHMTGGNNKL